RRLNNAMLAYRQDLLTRGLTPPQVDGVAEGTFVSEILVLAPRPAAGAEQLVSTPAVEPSSERDPGPAYEIQELKVELGQQVQAGQTLALLANHQSLFIEGHAYKREAHQDRDRMPHGEDNRVHRSTSADYLLPGPDGQGPLSYYPRSSAGRNPQAR